MSRSRLPIVVVLVVALALSGLTRQLTLGQRVARDRQSGTPGKAANLGKLNSFALGLLLGGLRGPLVIILWTSSEDQKTERNLQDFDSKVELIRQLQPEFVTVHLFQIWNKAFNISVLMANLPNKYTTILDALTYAFSVDREIPDDISIVSAIGGIYFDKYGNAAEKDYYRPRLRGETMADQERERVAFPAEKRGEVLTLCRLYGADTLSLIPRDDQGADRKQFVLLRADVVKPIAGQLTALGATITPRPARPAGANAPGANVRVTQHVPLLDAGGHILPEFLRPRMAPGVGGYDGSPLYYLKQFEPFPYGVSPYALGYDYYKRAQWLQEVRQQKHAQLSPRVISSRAALALQKWVEEEAYRGRREEAESFGLPVPKSIYELDLIAARLPCMPPKTVTPLYHQAIYSYDRASLLGKATLDEFAHHISVYNTDLLQYSSHRGETQCQIDLMAADRDFLKACVATGPERARLARSARDAYERSADNYTRYLIQFYISDQEAALVLPAGVKRRPDSLSRVSRPDLIRALAGLRQMANDPQAVYGDNDDLKELSTFVDRARTRAETLRPIADAAP